MMTKIINCLLLSYLIVVEAAPHDSMSQDLMLIKKCNTTFPTSKKTLNVALVEKHFANNLDESFKCFLHCLYHGYRWMNENGEFQLEEMKTTLGESNLDESSIQYLIATCTEIDIEDKCERAYLFTECFWMENTKSE